MVYVGIVTDDRYDMDTIYKRWIITSRQEESGRLELMIIEAAAKWASENLVKTDPYFAEKCRN
jgi:hypothetical protein